MFLAAKAEEDVLRLQTVMDAAHFIQYRERTKLSDNKELFFKTRERILECERLVMTTLDFNLDLLHPMNPSMRYCRHLWDPERTHKNKERPAWVDPLKQMAWSTR